MNSNAVEEEMRVDKMKKVLQEEKSQDFQTVKNVLFKN